MTSPTRRAALVYWSFETNAIPHGGDARARALERALVSSGFEVVQIPVTMFAAGPAGGGPVKFLQAFKRALFPLPFRRRSSVHTVQKRLQQEDFDLVVGCVPNVHRACLSASAGRVWLDYFDAWGHMAMNELPVTGWWAKPTVALQAGVWRIREMKESVRADFVSYAGYGDFLRSPSRSACWLPTPVLQLPEQAIPPSRGDTPTVGLIANWRYWPNIDAWAHFVEAWLPFFRQAGWQVVVAGIGSEELQAHDHVKNLGLVSDLEDFYGRIDVALVPVRRGGGVKVKALEALAWGRPVIATAHVLDGLPPHSREAVSVFAGVAPEAVHLLHCPQVRVEEFRMDWFTARVTELLGPE